MKPTAIVYSENEFGKLDGKVANGLVRHSDKYEIIGVIDSHLEGLDAGEYLDGIKNGIPIFRGLYAAINLLGRSPDYFIYGIAPLAPQLSKLEMTVFETAIRMGMNILNGLTHYLTEDHEIMALAKQFNVSIQDTRKPPDRKDLHCFTGGIMAVETPIIVIAGTDCAVGKRTTGQLLVDSLKKEGLHAVFITTGQTGILQGAKYGIAIDVLTSGFATGEVEHAVLMAQKENPDIMVIEGQGALSHQAFTSSSAIIRGGIPKAIIVQHPPKRTARCDFPNIPMPTLESEIQLLEVFSKSEVIAITINHEGMTEEEIEDAVLLYETEFGIPATDVLKHGCDKLIERLYEIFPELINIRRLLCPPQD